MMDTVFNCTQCGKCCHDLNIPLTIREAKDWLLRGHKIKILTEATPWINDVSSTDDLLLRKKSLTFPAKSGKLSIRVLASLVGYFQGKCPNLNSDLNCSIYNSRPLTCRIYPFEMNPNIILNPKNKLCPSDAWQSSESPRSSNTGYQIFTIDQDTQSNIKDIYTNNVDNVVAKLLICKELGISTSSLSNDGYLFHFPDQEKLLRILDNLISEDTPPTPDAEDHSQWIIYTQNEVSLSDLQAIGSNAARAHQLDTDSQEFISL